MKHYHVGRGCQLVFVTLLSLLPCTGLKAGFVTDFEIRSFVQNHTHFNTFKEAMLSGGLFWIDSDYKTVPARQKAIRNFNALVRRDKSVTDRALRIASEENALDISVFLYEFVKNRPIKPEDRFDRSRVFFKLYSTFLPEPPLGAHQALQRVAEILNRTPLRPYQLALGPQQLEIDDFISALLLADNHPSAPTYSASTERNLLRRDIEATHWPSHPNLVNQKLKVFGEKRLFILSVLASMYPHFLDLFAKQLRMSWLVLRPNFIDEAKSDPLETSLQLENRSLTPIRLEHHRDRDFRQLAQAIESFVSMYDGTNFSIKKSDSGLNFRMLILLDGQYNLSELHGGLALLAGALKKEKERLEEQNEQTSLTLLDAGNHAGVATLVRGDPEKFLEWLQLSDTLDHPGLASSLQANIFVNPYRILAAIQSPKVKAALSAKVSELVAAARALILKDSENKMSYFSTQMRSPFFFERVSATELTEILSIVAFNNPRLAFAVLDLSPPLRRKILPHSLHLADQSLRSDPSIASDMNKDFALELLAWTSLPTECRLILEKAFSEGVSDWH